MRKEDINIGRYYSSNNFSGKFGFAVQASDDPEIFGMVEQDPCEITYYLEDSDEARKHIKEVLDEQYDILDFPKKERVYTIKTETELDPLYDKLDVYIYEAKPIKKGQISYGGGKDWYKKFLPKGENLTEAEFYQKYNIVPKKEHSDLALCRITLGIKILSDLVLDGYCSLDAEL